MHWLTKYFDNLTNFLGYWIPKAWQGITDLGIAFWGIITALVGLLWAVISHIIPMVALILNMISGLATGTWHFTFPTILTNIFQLGNTLLPLEEFFQYLVAYGTLITALATYRFIKNLIPTEAGA